MLGLTNKRFTWKMCFSKVNCKLNTWLINFNNDDTDCFFFWQYNDDTDWEFYFYDRNSIKIKGSIFVFWGYYCFWNFRIQIKHRVFLIFRSLVWNNWLRNKNPSNQISFLEKRKIKCLFNCHFISNFKFHQEHFQRQPSVPTERQPWISQMPYPPLVVVE